MTPQDPAVVAADVWDDPSDRERRRRLVADVATAAVFTLLVGGLQLTLSPASALAAALLGVALAVRRTSIPVMVVAALAASVTQLLTAELALVADLAYVPLFFTLGAHRSRAVRRFGLACVLVAVAVAALWATGEHGIGGASSAAYGALTTGALTAVVTGGGWAAGVLRRQRMDGVQARVDATIAAVERRRLEQLYEQEQERARIAADMHDVVAHSWAVVAAQADGARYQIRTDPGRAEAALEVIGQTARTAMLDVRGLLTRLRERRELDVTLSLESSDAVVARMRASGMMLDFAQRGAPAPHSGEVAVAARLALAEALTNALKHGDLARPVAVEEDWADGYRLRVVNAVAAGREPSGSTTESGGHGLRGMTERIAELGGRVAASAGPGEWVTEVTIPEHTP
ncbi:MAG: histidine kinase [Nocardioides sp.]